METFFLSFYFSSIDNQIGNLNLRFFIFFGGWFDLARLTEFLNIVAFLFEIVTSSIIQAE